MANSGYGELGFVSDGRLEVVARLSGWTRGLCIVGDVAFVGTSRVIPAMLAMRRVWNPRQQVRHSCSIL